jgi:integrase
VGARYQDSGLVFTWLDGSPIHPLRFSRWFEQHARRASLPRVRLHDLRHSLASAALAAGVPAKVISEWLGHGGGGVSEASVNKPLASGRSGEGEQDG